MHFGKQTSLSGCMCIDGVMTLDSDNQKGDATLGADPNRRRVQSTTLSDTLRGVESAANAR